MALKSDLMASSLPAAAATKLGLDVLTAYSAAGSNQATATVLNGNNSNITTVAASTGVILPANTEPAYVMNNGANALSVYPPVGSAINGGTTNAAWSVPAGKCGVFIPAGLNIVGIVSA